MDPETVVEQIQADAASEAAAITVAGDTALAAEVAIVSEQVTEHAEITEERHEEILQGEAWLRNEVTLLSSAMSQLREQQISAREALASLQQTAAEILTHLSTSPVTNPLIPEPLTEAVPAVVEIPAEENVAVPSEAETPKPKRHRKI